MYCLLIFLSHSPSGYLYCGTCARVCPINKTCGKIHRPHSGCIFCSFQSWQNNGKSARVWRAPVVPWIRIGTLQSAYFATVHYFGNGEMTFVCCNRRLNGTGSSQSYHQLTLIPTYISQYSYSLSNLHKYMYLGRYTTYTLLNM